MSGIISGNMVGGAAPLKTLVITDDEGNELVGVVTGQETIFTANDNDVTKGKIYATDKGISVGTKEMPPYIYAIIDNSGLCYEVRCTSMNCDDVSGYIFINEYASGYLEKYYNTDDGRWYLEPSFVTEWSYNDEI